MSFLDTQPTALDSSDVAGSWAKFQVQDPRQCLADLREACRTNVPVTIGAPGGPTLSGTLWSVDDVRRQVHFVVQAESALSVEAFDVRRMWAVCYLGDVKLQFPLAGATLEGHPSPNKLSADLPRTLFRLHRRDGYRVRRAGDTLGVLQIGAAATGTPTGLRVSLADIGKGGCAFWLSGNGPRWRAGDKLQPVEVALPGEPIFRAALDVRHITEQGPAGSMRRVGCAWADLAPEALAALQRAIEPGQRRRGLLSLTFTI
jgi:hypothetical protein